MIAVSSHVVRPNTVMGGGTGNDATSGTSQGGLATNCAAFCNTSLKLVTRSATAMEQHRRMGILSTGSPDPDDPQPTADEPTHPTDLPLDSPRAAGSPPPPAAARHEGLVGDPAEPMGTDPRPGNV